MRFSTYRFPSGESLGTFNVEPLRSFMNVLGVDSARGEVFVQSCAGPDRACQRNTLARRASLDAFSADDADFSRPLRSIALSLTESVTNIAIDPSNDTVIALVWETTPQGYRVSARSVTLSRDATDLTTPVRELNLGNVGSLQLDPARGELYVFAEGEARIYASDASGDAAPLRSIPLPAFTSLLLSPARDEFHLRVEDTLETYALPAPAASGTLPLRTLTLPDVYDAIQFVDDAHGELWLGDLELSVFDLTASGEAVSSRSWPQYATPFGIFPERDEVVFLRPQHDLAFYGRTAASEVPLRILEGAGPNPVQHLLGVDVQRNEVFFISENGIVSVYARDATGDAAPLRQLSTALSPHAAVLDPVRAEILGGRGEQHAYPAGAVGQGQPTRSFVLQSGNESIDFSLGHLDRTHSQLLGVVGANGFGIVYAEPNDSAYDREPRYVAYSLTGNTSGSYPVSPISSRRGPALHDLDGENAEGRLVSVSDLAYDSARDEVVLAAKDCFAEDGEYTTTYSDCYYELRSYPRTGGAAYTLLELPEEIRALDYDDRTDLLLVSGQTNVMLFDRSQASGAPVLADGGLDSTSDAPEPAYQFPLVGTFRFCY